MKFSRKVRLIAISMGVIVAVLAVGSLPWPRLASSARPSVVRADGGCSMASLNGAYAVSRQGTLLTSVLGLPAPAPWGEVARADFNGAGSFSGTATVNIGGAVLTVPFTGAYTVHSDCTGAITVHPNDPNVPVTITEAIVVIRGVRPAPEVAIAVSIASGPALA